MTTSQGTACNCTARLAHLVALHIAAALLHLLVYRDRTVQRMLGLNPKG